MKDSNLRKMIISCFMVITGLLASAEPIIVNGVVTDTNQEPLIGATVMIKGRKVGTATDADGAFTLNAETKDVLVVSYLGYITKEIKIEGRTHLNIRLDEGSKTMDEVVVVGYGHQKKVNLSGSVVSVNVAELQESRPVSNISQALSAQAAGVRVNMSNNQPGDDNASIKIRGVGTLNNSSPLVIIDGMEGGINSVNPQNIESISILKDAASASIYGSRAANGVILITTKKGSSGKVTVNYNGYVSFESVKQNIHPITDYATYMDLVNEGYRNAGYGDNYIYSANVIEDWRTNSGSDPYLYPNNDFFKMTFRNAVANNHTVSLSGGSDKLKVYGSFSYLDNPGVIINSGFKKYTTNLRIEGNVNKYLTLGAQVSGYLSDREPAGGDLVDDIFSSASNTSPGITFVLPNGTMGYSPNPEEPQTVSTNNPIARTYRLEGGTRGLSVRPRFYATITPFKNFTITGSYQMNALNSTSRTKPSAVEYYDPTSPYEVRFKYDPESKVTVKNSQSWRYFNDLVARYSNGFGKFDFNIMAGLSHEFYRSLSSNASKTNLSDQSLWDFDAATGDAVASGKSSEWSMSSWFGRINLDWDDKYLLELNLRADGSSRFRKGKRWGYFPSASAAWRIDRESFMKSLTDSFLTNLKIRGSYGSLGNNAVGNYEYQSLYTNKGFDYVLGDSKAPGMYMTALANSELTWERTYVTDLGIDFGFFNNKLNGTFEWFNKRTSNILISLPAPLVHGSTDLPTVNAAEVTNKGVELTVGWNDRINDFKYGINANFTYITNCVTKYKGKGVDGRDISGNTLIWEGHPISCHYLYVVDRILQTDEDMTYLMNIIDNAKVIDGVRQNPFPLGTPERGDILYKDINGDGMIDANDRAIVSDGARPKYNLGITLEAGWKGIDFSLTLDGSFGAKTYWNSGYLSTTVAQGKMINEKVVEGRWVPGRTDATYPRLYPNSGSKINQQPSTFYLQNLDWLKFRNIQIGYTLPKKWSRVAYFSKVRIYCSLENFFTITSYEGFDPETGNSYPVMRQFALGLNVSF